MVMLGALKKKLPEMEAMPMSEGEAAAEGAAEEVSEEMEGEAAPAMDLSSVSDDMLLEEAKKRGLV